VELLHVDLFGGVGRGVIFNYRIYFEQRGWPWFMLKIINSR